MSTRSVPTYTLNPPFVLTDLLPTICPNVLTTVVSTTVYLVSVQVSLPSTAAAAAAITVQDRQVSPIQALSIALQPGDVQIVQFGGRTMLNGISVISDTANAASITVRWYQ